MLINKQEGSSKNNSDQSFFKQTKPAFGRKQQTSYYLVHGKLSAMLDNKSSQDNKVVCTDPLAMPLVCNNTISPIRPGVENLTF